jgi:hypothetical protein
MSSDTFTALVVIGFGAVMCLAALVVFGLGYFFIIRPNMERSKIVNQNWETFAREKSLTFAKGVRPSISGSYQGRQVKLAVINPEDDFAGPVRPVRNTISRTHAKASTLRASALP